MRELDNEEKQRIEENKGSCFVKPWEKWGPFVSERAWGTVREDYSANGDAWNYFPHDHARLRAFRWGEDGIAGFCDRYQVLIFTPAFWNGKDPILKERLFGLNANEGNHGEDVKELYYYLDALPSHAYLKYLYKYPQKEFPYDALVEENQRRTTNDREFELIDTGIFQDNRYFDIFIEYAKVDSEEWVAKIEAFNRGPDAAPLHILPQLFFRNQWSWDGKGSQRPVLKLVENEGFCLIETDDAVLPSPPLLIWDYHLGKRYFYATPGAKPVFTENDSNYETLWSCPNPTPYVKDAFHRFVVQGDENAVNATEGSKSALHYVFPAIPPGKSEVIYIRLSQKPLSDPLADIEAIIAKRKKETDRFYETIYPPKATAEEKSIQRQSFAGMIWNKQLYYYDVGVWVEGDNPKEPPPLSRKRARNGHWRHLESMRLFSMPDKWEYPWFAAWDLTFHTVTFSLIDLDFAKEQLWMLLSEQFQHPNGAVPAYEWDFSNTNPPIQAWAVLRLYEKDQDLEFLERCFHKLMLNFSWWVNRVDARGNNMFEGGFLGMDNIALINRSNPPPGVSLDEIDGVGWASLFCLCMMRMGLILAKKEPTYETLGLKFFHHFVYIGASMRKGYWRPYDMWHQEDGFFYGAARHVDGRFEQMRLRSLTGLIPLLASDIWDETELQQYPEFYVCYRWLAEKNPSLFQQCVQEIPTPHGTKHVLSLMSATELQRLMTKVWDPNEFRSDYGVRSLSKFHEKHPIEIYGSSIGYEPGEARERMMGGNSNWRGPIWFPVNYFIIESLHRLGNVFQDTIQVKVDGEPSVTLSKMSHSFAEKLLALFKRNAQGKRPLFGEIDKFQNDPHFRDYLIFPEHFHGDTGRALGASHQNGWTGLISNLIAQIRL